MGRDPVSLSDQKRADILRAATEEFAAMGFASASVDAISARAGVSKRTLYNHFASKRELFDTIHEELLAQAFGAVTLVYDPDESIETQLLEVVRQMLAVRVAPAFLTAARVLFRGGIVEHARSREAFGQALDDGGAAAEVFRAAAADGVLDLHGAPPARAAYQLGALIDAFAFWPQVLGGLLPPPADAQAELARETVALILARYRAAPSESACA